MENTDNDHPVDSGKPIRRTGGGRIWVPVGFVLVGTGLLLHQLGLGIPDWIFSWPILLMAIGVFLGLSHGFRGPGWLIMILIGGFFFMDQVIPGFDFHRFLWPAIIIVVGLIMLIRPKKPHWMDHEWQEKCNYRYNRRWQRMQQRRGFPGFTSDAKFDSAAGATFTGSSSKTTASEDYIDATTVFGGIHKNIVSKNFRGGDLTIFMGGAEINLSQADIQGTAILDITQIMGGTKIIVPPHWEIRSQLTSVFGNIEDKRQNISNTDPQKVLVIDGSSVFGGIEIRNY